MTFPYDAAYTGKAGVVKLVDAIVPNWRKTADGVPDLDAEKLFETLKRVVSEWRELGKFSVLDKDLQALLCLVAATDWFSKVQLAELDAWASEVADCGEAEWMKNFPESELRTAVNANLKGAQVTEVKIDTNQSCISVEYTGGDFGDGPHDGCVYLDDDGVKIYDRREKGKALAWTGDIPDDIKGLGKCLSGKKWKITWEYDGEEQEEAGEGEGWNAEGWSAEGWSAEGGGYGGEWNANQAFARPQAFTSAQITKSGCGTLIYGKSCIPRIVLLAKNAARQDGFRARIISEVRAARTLVRHKAAILGVATFAANNRIVHCDSMSAYFRPQQGNWPAHSESVSGAKQSRSSCC